MVRHVKLPVKFDPVLLQRDLQQIVESDWVGHFNGDHYEGNWSGIALRSIDGDSRQLYPAPSARGPFIDTPTLDRCPNIRAAVALLSCPVRAVRLLRLAAGSSIKEHAERDLVVERGLGRLHVPITTNPDVAFYLDGDRVDMAPGECWYLNFSLRHRVDNHGTADRVHLVLDCSLDPWLRSHILGDREITPSVMG